MNKQEQVQQMTTYMANFVSHIAKVLPDDIIAKLDELGAQEDAPLSKVIYETMKRNQKLAKELNRPSCQDTGVLQFWVKCGVDFPLIGEVEGLLKEAVVKSTFEAPLRHNSVETFDEFNTGLNVGKGTPTVWWDIIPNSDKCEIYAYMAGGGCTSTWTTSRLLWTPTTRTCVTQPCCPSWTRSPRNTPTCPPPIWIW